MSKYIVNVHYDVTIPVEVEANSREDAKDLARIEAQTAPQEDQDWSYVEACIVDEIN